MWKLHWVSTNMRDRHACMQSIKGNMNIGIKLISYLLIIFQNNYNQNMARNTNYADINDSNQFWNRLFFYNDDNDI